MILADLCSRYEIDLFLSMQKRESCVSLMKMSPLTAVLKCPHYGKGHCSNESEGEAEVPSS